MKTMKNNKGIAMVTVLIGMSFIIILASSLVYMSYMNYITKAVRFASTDNFYTDEFALDDLCMSLQQTVAGSASVDSAKATLRHATGAVNTGVGYVYDNDTVASLIQVASQEASISVNTIVDTTVSANYIEGAASVQLLGVEITSTTPQGYQSTICTDITINFPNGGLGDLDVNDFSLITDSPIVINNGDVFFSGCVYIDKGAGTNALTVNTGGNVHMLSPRGIINGNLVINGTGLVSITGIVTVVGDIYVNDNATLLCSDKLQHTGEIHVASGARVVGTSDFDAQDINTDSIPTSGLTPELFTDIYVRSPETTTFKPVSLQDYINGTNWSKDFQNMPSGLRVGMGLGTQGTINDEFDNSIIMSPSDVTIRGTLTNSSVVCSGAIIFDIASAPTYMQNMTDDVYDAARSVMIREGRNLPGIANPNWASGFWVESYIDSADDTHVEHYADGTVRTFVYKGGSNYIPCGYFLVPDTSSVITGIFSGVQGNADPGNSTIYIENWIKE